MGENDAEGLDLLFVNIPVRLHRHIPPGEPGAAGGNDHIHILTPAPCAQLGGDLIALVGQDLAIGEDMACLRDTPDKHLAGSVILEPAAVGYGEHGDAHGDEFPAFVNPRHGVSPISISA